MEELISIIGDQLSQALVGHQIFISDAVVEPVITSLKSISQYSNVKSITMSTVIPSNPSTDISH